MRKTAWEMMQPPPATANYLRLQKQFERYQKLTAPPRALADVARLQRQVSQLSRSGAAEQLAKSASASQFHVLAAETAERLSRQLGAASAAALQTEQLRAMYAQANPSRVALERIQHQIRSAGVADPALAQSLARSVQAAASRLSTADKVRVRNALSLWSAQDGRLARDRYYLALLHEQLAVWSVDGNHRLQAFTAIVRRSVGFRLLGEIGRALRRSPALLASGESAPPRTGWVHDRVDELLRQLRSSRSPHAPPTCLA